MTDEDGNVLNVRSFQVVGGALVDAPVYETHRRGRNWMAKIQPNADAPGGWDRSFARTGRGEDMKYIIADIFSNDVLEFGADYVTSLGKKKALRSYAVVVSVTSDELRVVLFDRAIEAWQARDAVSCLPKQFIVTPVPASEDSRVAGVIRVMATMTDDQRLAIMDAFCSACGRKQPDVGPTCSCVESPDSPDDD